MSRRSYDGPALDGTVQYITERPELDERGETVDATPREDAGTITAENVPVPNPDPEPDDPPKRPDCDGQTTLDDWGWSA